MQITIENHQKVLLSEVLPGEVFVRDNGASFMKLHDGTVMPFAITGKTVPVHIDGESKVRIVKRITLHMD